MTVSAQALRFTPARTALVLALLLVVLAGSLLAAVFFGEEGLSFRRALFERGSVDFTIFWSLRLPRALLGAIVGAALAASGSTLQALMRNPLADPFVLGVSGGAALGATIAIVLGLGTLGQLGWLSALGAVSAPSAFALVGALGAMLLVFGLARAQGGTSSYAALLSGVVFNAFAIAVITFLRALATPEKMGEIIAWLTGALRYESTGTLLAAALIQAVALGGMWLYAAPLNLLTLGDEDAAALGVHVPRTRALLLVFSSLAVACSVALSGLIGFVGLIIPHLLRVILGPDQRLLLPASALGGAAFLVLSDLLARLLFGVLASEPPVGVITALLGGPFFLFLLWRRERAS